MPVISKQSPTQAPSKNSTSVLNRIKPIGFESNDGLKMIVYGKSGTGKTTLSATFPGPMLWVICSGGTNPGELRSIDTPEYRKKVSQVILRHTDEIFELAEHAKTTGKYATIVLDHASGVQDKTLAQILGLESLPAQKSWGMATQQQYGQSSLMMKELLRSLLNLPQNVVIISQERTFGDAEGANELIAPTIGPSLTPSVTGWLAPACDYVVQTFLKPKTKTVTLNNKQVEQRARGVDYCVRTGAHDVYLTKFRVPKGRVLPEFVTDPSYDKLLAVITGKTKQ